MEPHIVDAAPVRHPAPPSRAALATRLAFLISGFALSCWAPLVPYVKHSLNLDERLLGMLLLCMGVGSVLSMLVTGGLCSRLGSKLVIVACAWGLALTVPLLALATTPLQIAAALLVFGAALGSIDVAMNVHAVEVEKLAGKPLMSGFHALFSIGGFAGATVMTALLSARLSPLASTCICAAVMAVVALFLPSRLLASGPAASGAFLARPRGIVLLLAPLAGITFLAEGAMLDWGALLITEKNLVPVSYGGLGYILFSIAMTAGRLSGDAITARLGDRTVLQWGGALAVGGFVMLLTAPLAPLALAGFVLIGLGASNIVPVFFRQAAAQQDMPTSLAIAAMTTTGYAGVLLGPAAVGFVAKASSLPAAFWMLAVALALIPLTAHKVSRS
ncbi:MFS transporter [Massilia sp. CF038]|uniref:MFS transporter n=1 Tax=Massilia sp. CF038 TaxID=1881045 RepID=UPI00091F207E|nr:MFS transporter [Massilia sp. CF038]SHG75629.1 Predicted arabinose efflux permease, MFS family [Massilia sp. CF038]